MRLIAALALATAALLGFATHDGAAAAWPGCDSFTTQPEAQRWWEDNGRPARGDGDGDGRVCESLPQGGGGQRGNCKRVKRTVAVALSTRRYPHTTRHIRDAIRKGKAKILHIARHLAKRHREQSLKGIPTKKGYDRDEYPPAASREGGKGASVRYVPSSDNRGAGASMGTQLRPYCNGQAFRLRLVSASS